MLLVYKRRTFRTCAPRRICRVERSYMILFQVFGIVMATILDTCQENYEEAKSLYKEGRYDEALKTYREVLKIQKVELGDYHDDTLKTQSDIGTVLFRLGKTDEALRISEKVYEVQKRSNPEHPDTLATRNIIALILDENHEYEEALKIFRELLEIEERTKLDTLGSRHNIASVLHKLGRYQEALDGFSEVYKIMERKLGKDHTSTLTLQNNMANVFFALGKYEEARQILEETYEVQKRTIGMKHPSTLVTQNNIARVLLEQGRQSEAMAVFEDVYKYMVEVLGQEHPHAISIRIEIANILRKTGKYEEALLIYKDLKNKSNRNFDAELLELAMDLDENGNFDEALRLYTEICENMPTTADSRPNYLSLRYLIARILKNLNRYEESLKIFKQVYKERAHILGPDNEKTLDAWGSIAEVLMELGKYSEALDIFRKVLEKRISILGPEHQSVLYYKSTLASLLSMMGNFEEALKVSKDIYEIEKRKGPEHPEALKAEQLVVKYFGLCGKHAEALEMMFDILERQKDAGSSILDTVLSMISIATSLTEMEKYNKVLDSLNEVVEKNTEILGPEHIDTLSSRNDYAKILLNRNELHKALEIYEEIYKILKKSNASHLHNPKALKFENAVKINIAVVYTKLGKYDEALEIFKEVFEKTKRTVDAENTELLIMQQSIASVLACQKKLSEALPLFYDVYRKRAKSLGRRHPLTLQSLECIEKIEPLMPKSNLFIPVRKNDTIQVRNLIKEGHDINLKDTLGMCPLHLASENGNIEIMKLLLEHGASYNIRNEEGYRPLSFAANEECHRLLRSIEAVFEAVKKSNFDVIKKTVKNLTIINVKDDTGSTVLHWACNRNDGNIVNFLLSEGADPTLVTNKGNTALHIACSKRSLNTVDDLIRHVKENYPAIMTDFINGRTTGKNTTSLHVAAKNGDFEIMKLLIDNGADLKAKNSDGKIPLDLAPKNVDFFNNFEEKSEL